MTRSKEICIGYKKITTRYTKLIQNAKNKYNWDTSKFMNVIAGLFDRKDKEVTRYLESGCYYGNNN